jgi:acetolactate synthase regulatory subunit
MSMNKRYKPIEIIAEDPSDIFELNRIEIAKAIVDGIQHGIRTKKKRVDFAKVLIKGIIVITLSIDSREFSELLEEQLQILIDVEEYESCALVVKLQNKLNKQKL